MTDSPDAIRADIENTRRDLGSNVDALADKVTPSKIVHRQTDKVKDAVGSVKDRVDPVAVGLIAFGAGLLAASLIPASTKEKELATSIKESAQPLIDEVTDAAKDVAGNLREPVQDAAVAVKDTATDAATTVKEQATSTDGLPKYDDRG